jgi:Spy/CpxP family protein refolding chaperone
MRKLLLLIPFFVVMLMAQENEADDPRAIIEKIRIYRLTKELDLTTEQAVKFFPRLNELQKIDKDFRSQQMEILEELRTLVRNNAEDREILQSLSRYESLFKDKVERQLSKMKEIRTLLTPVQQAKYLIFQDEFEREIRRMIKEVKKIQPH